MSSGTWTADIPEPVRSNGASYGKYRYFGLLRFVLAAMVMVAHFSNNILPANLRDFFFPFGLGSIGVAVFFALSGFIIMEAVNEFYRDRPAAFLLNRLLRIVPPFAAALMIAVAIQFILLRAGVLRPYWVGPIPSDADFTVMSVLRNLFGIVPGLKPSPGTWLFIGIEWAIRVELQFYAIVASALVGAAILARLLAKRQCVLFVYLLGLLALLHLIAFALWAVDYAPATFGFVPYFIFGAATYYAMRGSRFGVAAGACMLPLMIYHFLAYQIPTLLTFQMDKNAVPLITSVHAALQIALLFGLLAAIAALSRLSLPIGRRVDRLLGDLSYPLYLNHVVGGTVAVSLINLPPVPLFLLACLTSVALSAIMHLLVEPPLRAIRNGIRGHTLS